MINTLCSSFINVVFIALQELLTPMRAYELMRQMTNEDLQLLWMNGTYSRPESLIMWSVPVPPVPIRPSVQQDTGGGSTEDDITVKLQVKRTYSILFYLCQ